MFDTEVFLYVIFWRQTLGLGIAKCQIDFFMDKEPCHRKYFKKVETVQGFSGTLIPFMRFLVPVRVLIFTSETDESIFQIILIVA